MVTLKGERIYLRALEPEDLELIYAIENDESVWEVSQTQTPYSRFLIKQYLENCHKDIYEVKQLRLVIVTNDDEAVGFVDLFDFDPKNDKVGVGVLVLDYARGKKYGREALELLINYVFTNLYVHQIYANVLADNLVSIKLFEGLGFIKTGVKKDWVLEGNQYKDEYLFQLIQDVH
ncbi:MAG: GNAT family N-acetyltransferase [Flavobacteriaceae bacterium]